MLPRLRVEAAMLVLALAGSVLSQNTNATCATDFSWASNSLQESPCKVASLLAAPCYKGFEIDALTPPVAGVFYESLGDSDCVCSMVFYNLLSCCSVCQGGSSQLWTDYVSPCNAHSTPITVASYSRAIPNDTTVPAWAFLNVQSTNNFSVVAAEQFFDTNSSNIGPPSSSMSSSTSPTSSSSSFTSLKSSTLSPTSSKTSLVTSSSSAVQTSAASSSHKYDTRVIVGCVTGGVAGVALLALALVLWLRRSRRARTSHAARDEIAPTVVGSLSPKPQQSPSLPGKFYDPDDPTTFPKSQDQPSMGYAHAQRGSMTSTEIARPSGYTGVAEV